jgi:hypothetical protein
MAEYYVVRDKNTGLYFRGKGVNRWGKYYNQASIYRIRANAENTIKEVSWRGEQAEVVPIHIVETSADVVEVVRCKDCDVPHNKWTGCPHLNGLIPPPNHYCACGTPKERGGEK